MGVNLTSSGGSNIVVNEKSSNINISGGSVAASGQLSSYQRAVIAGTFTGTETEFYQGSGNAANVYPIQDLPPLP